MFVHSFDALWLFQHLLLFQMLLAVPCILCVACHLVPKVGLLRIYGGLFCRCHEIVTYSYGSINALCWDFCQIGFFTSIFQDLQYKWESGAVSFHFCCHFFSNSLKSIKFTPLKIKPSKYKYRYYNFIIIHFISQQIYNIIICIYNRK